jgi:hypothetical protein
MEIVVNKTNGRRMIGLTCLTLIVSFLFSVPAFGCPLVIQKPAAQNADDKDGKKENGQEKIGSDQKELADRYRLLEEKLFSLHEYEKGQNPLRSKLLEQAFLQSQERMTTLQLKRVVGLIEKSKLKDAEKEQEVVLVQLNELLELLQSEDRGKRVRDEIKRHQDYLKEVERLLRIQKGLRGQAEGGVDRRRLANSENKAADRAKKLAQEIRDNEESESSENSEQSDAEGRPGEGSEGEPKDGDGKPGDGKSGENELGDQKDGKGKDKKNDTEEKDKKPGDGKPKDSKPSDGKPSDGKAGGKGEPSEGQGGEGGEGGSSGEQQQSEDNPVRKRIEAAEKKMRDAQQKLEKAKRGGAIEDMKTAEREMALAKKELEEILRQLREEEVERTLAMLEGRFRMMLERQVKVYESTRKLDRIIPEQRGTEFEIKAGKLSTQQAAIAKDCGRALMVLLEDGSSVAFPATVEEMHEDMQQVAKRLASAKVGKITIQIEEDIIDTLDYLIEALVKTQQDMERMKKAGQQAGGGQPGDKPLVDQLAEIKMLRGLQERIFRRHRRYSQFLEDPDDLVGDTDDPDMKAALSRLADKQAKLTDIARDIVNEKNK